MTWFIVTWFLAGLITFAVTLVLDYRGKEYEDCDFDDLGKLFILVVAIGYLTPIIAIITFTDFKKIKEKIHRFIYKISNVGLKEKGEEHETD